MRYVIAGIAVLVLAVLAFGGYVLVRTAEEVAHAQVAAAKMAQIKNGQTRDHAEDILGEPGTTAVVYKAPSPAPANSSCRYYVDKATDTDKSAKVTAYRLCYDNGDRLISKITYSAKV